MPHPLPRAMKLKDSEETTEENERHWSIAAVNNDNDKGSKNLQTKEETIHINLSDRKMITERSKSHLSLSLSLIRRARLVKDHS